MRALVVGLGLVAAGAAAAYMVAFRGPTREDVIRELVTTVYQPAFRTARSDARAFAAAGCSLEPARAAWSKARTSWKLTEAYQFGPARDLRIASNTDFWPLRPWAVEAEIAKTSPIDASMLPSPAKGFPAAELILFGARSAALTERDCAYLKAIADDLAAQLDALAQAWDKSPPIMLDAAVNQLVSLAYTIEDMKLARPLGKRHGNTPQPEAVESSVSNHSLADLAANLDGMRAVVKRLEPLVERTAAGLTAKTMAAIDELDQALTTVKPHLAAAATAQAPETETAFKASTKLTKILATEYVGALGVTPTFSDNDGD